MIRIVFDEWVDDCARPGCNADHQAPTNRKCPGMIDVMHQSAAYQRRDDEAQDAHQHCSKLTPRKTLFARGAVVYGRPNSKEICGGLSECDEDGEYRTIADA